MMNDYELKYGKLYAFSPFSWNQVNSMIRHSLTDMRSEYVPVHKSELGQIFIRTTVNAMMFEPVRIIVDMEFQKENHWPTEISESCKYNGKSVMETVNGMYSKYMNRFNEDRRLLESIGFNTIGYEVYRSGAVHLEVFYTGTDNMENNRPFIVVNDFLFGNDVREVLSRLPFDQFIQLNETTRDVLLKE